MSALDFHGDQKLSLALRESALCATLPLKRSHSSVTEVDLTVKGQSQPPIPQASLRRVRMLREHVKEGLSVLWGKARSRQQLSVVALCKNSHLAPIQAGRGTIWHCDDIIAALVNAVRRS